MLRHTTSVRYNDLEEGKPVRVSLNGKEVIVVLVLGKVYAMDADCSHEGGPLEQGSIEGYSLTCPWHQAVFDIKTGKASTETNWASDIDSYKVILDDKSGQISIDIDPVGASQDKNEGDTQPSTREQDNISPSKTPIMQVTLLDKVMHKDTDIMSFKFARNEDQDYEAGQFYDVDLGTTEDPKGSTRAFTIASSPTEKDVILISTRIRDTPFKQKLAKLEKGSSIKISGPAGEFTLPDDHSQSVVFLSGGIGVTPFRSMVKFATDKQLPLKITMFDSNRNLANILYKDEFDSWTKLNENLKMIYTTSEEEAENLSSVTRERKNEKGMIDKAMLMRHLSKDDLDDSVFYICGPPAMLNAMKKLLSEEIGVSADRIRTEEFSGY